MRTLPGCGVKPPPPPLGPPFSARIGDAMAHDPVVFISSTSDDLKEHREQAFKAAVASGFSPRMKEYFPASGHAKSLQACRELVAQAEVVVEIVAHRYGWVPDGPQNPDRKSITWLECDYAWEVTKKEVLAYLVDPDYDWPADKMEEYRLVTERNKPRILDEVTRNEKKLGQFKVELSRYVRAKFTDAASLRPLVSEALAAWRVRHHPTTAPATYQDPDPYLKALEDETRQIRIKGLKTKRAEPYFFGIDEIYIPLTTLAGHDLSRKGAGQDLEQQRRIVLEQALSQRKVVIVGDPGSGKSTFLRRVAFELCRTLRGTRPDGAPPSLAPDDGPSPTPIRFADLAPPLPPDKSPNPADSP